MPETVHAIEEMTQRSDDAFPQHRGHRILIEQAANGAAVTQMLGHTMSSVLPISPQGGKVARASAAIPQIEAGNIHLPGYPNNANTGPDPDPGRTPAFAQELIAECETFPNGRHDDQVDALTQTVNYLTTPQIGGRLRWLTAPPRRGAFSP